MRIITLEEARAQNSTAAELRVLANCLERIAAKGYPYETESKTIADDPAFVDLHGRVTIHEMAYDYKACRENAAGLRRLAAQLGRGK